MKNRVQQTRDLFKEVCGLGSSILADYLKDAKNKTVFTIIWFLKQSYEKGFDIPYRITELQRLGSISGDHRSSPTPMLKKVLCNRSHR